MGKDLEKKQKSTNLAENIDSGDSKTGLISADESVVPPDGGWGWMVVFASFLIHVIADGIVYSFGVFLMEFVVYFKAGRGAVSWIGALQPAVTFTVGPLAGVLTNRYGCRAVTIAGAVVAAAGLILSAWAPNLYFLYFTSGIMAGVGFGLIYLPAIVCVAEYFEKKRSLATGLAVCGSGFGTFILAPLTGLMVQRFSWQGAMLILGGVVLNVIICGLIFLPLKARVLEPSGVSSQTDQGSLLQNTHLENPMPSRLQNAEDISENRNTDTSKKSEGGGCRRDEKIHQRGENITSCEFPGIHNSQKQQLNTPFMENSLSWNKNNCSDNQPDKEKKTDSLEGPSTVLTKSDNRQDDRGCADGTEAEKIKVFDGASKLSGSKSLKSPRQKEENKLKKLSVSKKSLGPTSTHHGYRDNRSDLEIAESKPLLYNSNLSGSEDSASSARETPDNSSSSSREPRTNSDPTSGTSDSQSSISETQRNSGSTSVSRNNLETKSQGSCESQESHDLTCDSPDSPTSIYTTPGSQEPDYDSQDSSTSDSRKVQDLISDSQSKSPTTKSQESPVSETLDSQELTPESPDTQSFISEPNNSLSPEYYSVDSLSELRKSQEPSTCFQTFIFKLHVSREPISESVLNQKPVSEPIENKRVTFQLEKSQEPVHTAMNKDASTNTQKPFSESVNSHNDLPRLLKNSEPKVHVLENQHHLCKPQDNLNAMFDFVNSLAFISDLQNSLEVMPKFQGNNQSHTPEPSDIKCSHSETEGDCSLSDVPRDRSLINYILKHTIAENRHFDLKSPLSHIRSDTALITSSGGHQERSATTVAAKCLHCKRTISNTSSSASQTLFSRKDIFYSGSLQNIPMHKYEADVFKRNLNHGPEEEGRNFDGMDKKEGECYDVMQDFRSTTKRMLSLTLLKNPVFLMFAVSNFFTSLGFNMPFIFLPDRAKLSGIDENRAAFLLAVIGIANTVGRVVFGYLSDKSWVNRLMLYNTALTLCGVVTALCPLFGGEYGLLVMYASIFGLLIGVYVSLTSIVLVDLLGLEYLTNSFGLLLLFQGAATFIGPPIAGWLCDWTGSYDISFVLMGSLIAVSGAMLYCLPLVERCYTRRLQTMYRNNEFELM